MSTDSSGLTFDRIRRALLVRLQRLAARARQAVRGLGPRWRFQPGSSPPSEVMVMPEYGDFAPGGDRQPRSRRSDDV